MAHLDALDRGLIAALDAAPRAGIMELARRLGIARGTVQARLDKLQRRGAITGFGPDVDPSAIGYPVLAFVSIEFAQGRRGDVVEHLRAIPEVLEVHTITGQADLHCRVVARTHEHLQEVLDAILEAGGIDRTTTQIALAEEIGYRTLPLVQAD